MTPEELEQRRLLARMKANTTAKRVVHRAIAKEQTVARKLVKNTKLLSRPKRSK